MKQSSHIKTKGKHDTLTRIVQDILITQGLEASKNIEYSHGELDIISNRIYYEVKCNFTPKGIRKAYNQISRAISHNQCDYGYLVTYQGLYDILK